MRSRLSPETLHPDRELADFLTAAPGAGAVVSFCGIARPRGAAGEDLVALHLDHYPGMTERSLEAIAADGMARFEISAVHIVHRCGSVAPGETIVFVAAAARHRRAAFEAADYLMDRLKTEAMFWKREQGVDGSRWIEASSADLEDAARWEDRCPGSTKA